MDQGEQQEEADKVSFKTLLVTLGILSSPLLSSSLSFYLNLIRTPQPLSGPGTVHLWEVSDMAALFYRVVTKSFVKD